MSPSEIFGTEFFCAAHTLRKADGSVHPFHDVGVCIKPRGDEASTLAYGWDIMRELAKWVSEEFKDRPQNETNITFGGLEQ